jgi:hypothetical protein
LRAGIKQGEGQRVGQDGGPSTSYEYLSKDQKEKEMLEIHKNVPLHCWKIVTHRGGEQTICYNHDGYNIYDVPVWELKTPGGLDWWLKHLRRKIWFADTEAQFWEALREGNLDSLPSQYR